MNKKPIWKRWAGVASFISILSTWGWLVVRWIGLAGLPEDASAWYRAVISITGEIPLPVYWSIFGALVMGAVVFTAIWLNEKWESLRHRMWWQTPFWIWRYVRITAIGKVPVHYRFVVRKCASWRNPRTRYPFRVVRIRKGQDATIRFDIPDGVHDLHLIIEVPAIYKLLFPHSRSDGRWIETIASNGRRRYKTVFVVSRGARQSPEWVQVMPVTRYGEGGWGAVMETLRKSSSVLGGLADRGRMINIPAPPPPPLEDLIAQLSHDEANEAKVDD